MNLRRDICGGLATVSASVLLGCASQGPLRPPSLHLPAQPSGVAVQRVGDTVVLQWTAPTRTTDGGDLRDRHEHALPLTAEVCRVAGTACVPVVRLASVPGEVRSYTDKLSGGLVAGSPVELRYRLRMLNRDGRAAEARELVTAAGEAPPPVRDLTVASAALGTSLGWQPVAPLPGDAVVLRVQAAAKTAAESRVKLLRVALTTRDPGGAIDSEGKPGDTYVAVRSRPLMNGPAGSTVTLESAPSSVTLSADALPPPPTTPVGLVTVPSSAGGVSRIDLSWQPDSAPVRYIVLRSEAGGPVQTITAAPISAFSYTDTAVRAGLAYRYSVVAVDVHGTRSTESVSATETAPAP